MCEQLGITDGSEVSLSKDAMMKALRNSQWDKMKALDYVLSNQIKKDKTNVDDKSENEGEEEDNSGPDDDQKNIWHIAESVDK